MDEVRADEAGAAGDEQLHRREHLPGDQVGGQPVLPRRQGRRVGAGRAEDRVGGARRGPAEVGGRAAVHGHGQPGALEGRARRAPTTCTSRRRRRAGRRAAALGDRDQRGGEVAGVGRAAELVVDHGHLVALGAEPQHRVDEVLAVRAEHPRGADDRVRRRRRGRHRALARELGAPVGADRAGGRVLGVRRRRVARRRRSRSRRGRCARRPRPPRRPGGPAPSPLISVACASSASAPSTSVHAAQLITASGASRARRRAPRRRR